MNFVLPWDLKDLTLPSSRKEHLLVEHTVFFVLQHGDQFEVRLRMDPQASKKIPFIDIHHRLHPYYQWLKSTRACLEERSPHLLPEGWTFWRKERKTAEGKKKEEESTACLDGLLGHYDEDDSPTADITPAIVAVQEKATKGARKDSEPLTKAKAIADLNSLLGGYHEALLSPSFTADYAEAVTSPPAPAEIEVRESLYEAAVTSPPASSSVDDAVLVRQRQRQHRFHQRKQQLLQQAARSSSDILPGLSGGSTASSKNSTASSPTSKMDSSPVAHPSASSSSSAPAHPQNSEPVDTVASATQDPGPHAEKSKEKKGKKRTEATAPEGTSKKKRQHTVFQASASTDRQTHALKDATESDSLLHSLLEYAENAQIDEAVMAGTVATAGTPRPAKASKSETPRKSKESARKDGATPSAASTDSKGSKTEKKERRARKEASNELLSALGKYDDGTKDDKSSTPWPKPSGKLMPDRIAFILDIGVLLLRQPLVVVKLARKVSWQEFSFLKGEEGAYFRQVVDVCITKIENDEHVDVTERPIPNRLVGFFGKLIMEQQRTIERQAHSHLKPAGKVSVLADDQQRLKEERRQRALKLLKDKEKALQLHTLGSRSDDPAIKKCLGVEIARVSNGS